MKSIEAIRRCFRDIMTRRCFGFSAGGLFVAACLGLGIAAGSAADVREEAVLSPGDMVRISMVEDPEVFFEGEVSVMGTVPLPYIRDFRVAGLTSSEAEAALSKALCEELYQSATVSVGLIRKAPGKVYVYGAIKNPGVVNLPTHGEMTVMQLVSEMGGLTSWADPSKAYILRQPDPSKPGDKIAVDLGAMFQEGAAQIFVPLRGGDIFFVPGQSGSSQQVMSSDECQIVVVGEVNAPGIVLFAPGEQRTVMRAIFKAAGFTKFARSKQVRLIRYGSEGNRSEQTIDVTEIIDDGYLEKDIELQPGDMLIVPQKFINF